MQKIFKESLLKGMHKTVGGCDYNKLVYEIKCGIPTILMYTKYHLIFIFLWKTLSDEEKKQKKKKIKKELSRIKKGNKSKEEKLY